MSGIKKVLTLITAMVVAVGFVTTPVYATEPECVPRDGQDAWTETITVEEAYTTYIKWEWIGGKTAKPEFDKTAENFDEAINLLKKSQILLPNDVDISSRIEKNIKNIISETKQNAENTKNYSDEISKLKQLQTKNPDNQDITNAISEIEKIHMNYLFSQSDNLADQKKYEDAIQLLSDNKDLYPNLTADFNQKIKEYRDIMPMLLYNLVYFFRRGYTV